VRAARKNAHALHLHPLSPGTTTTTSTPGRPASPPPPPRPAHLPTPATPVHHAPTTAPGGTQSDPPPAWPPPLPERYVPGPPARKRIVDAAGLAAWRAAPSYAAFIAFVLHLNAAVKGVRTAEAGADEPPLSSSGTALLEVLATLEAWVDEIPPAAAALRYGNPAFRDWHARVVDAAPALLARVLPPDAPAGLADELAPYLIDSLGNAARIDYGTGHEATFAALLFVLARVPGCLGPADAAGLVARVFAGYVRLMRKVQTTYW
jgi:serine/threonine-protein phosphatase 2A activator